MNVVTVAFEDAADAQSDALGFDPAIVYLPHPIQNRTTAELHALADQHVAAILARLVSPVDGPQSETATLNPP